MLKFIDFNQKNLTRIIEDQTKEELLKTEDTRDLLLKARLVLKNEICLKTLQNIFNDYFKTVIIQHPHVSTWTFDFYVQSTYNHLIILNVLREQMKAPEGFQIVNIEHLRGINYRFTVKESSRFF